MDLGLSQRGAAEWLRVDKTTVGTWERNLSTPASRFLPAIQLFLGHTEVPSRESLPEQLRFARWALELSQRELATVLGVNRCTVSAWEAGRHRPNRTHQVQISALVTSALQSP